jgi:hypothetical protein
MGGSEATSSSRANSWEIRLPTSQLNKWYPVIPEKKEDIPASFIVFDQVAALNAGFLVMMEIDLEFKQGVDNSKSSNLIPFALHNFSATNGGFVFSQDVQQNVEGTLLATVVSCSQAGDIDNNEFLQGFIGSTLSTVANPTPITHNSSLWDPVHHASLVGEYSIMGLIIE